MAQFKERTAMVNKKKAASVMRQPLFPFGQLWSDLTSSTYRKSHPNCFLQKETGNFLSAIQLMTMSISMRMKMKWFTPVVNKVILCCILGSGLSTDSCSGQDIEALFEVHHVYDKYFFDIDFEPVVKKRGCQFELFEGIWIDTFENGALKEVTVYRNGRKNGASAKWDSNGRITSSSTYLEDVPVGPWNSYASDGSILVQTNEGFEGRKLSARMVGQPKMRVTEYCDGEWSEMFPSGVLREKVYYKNGWADGLYEEFYENASIKVRGIYILGRRVDDWFWYQPDGKVLVKANYAKDGWLKEKKEFDLDGALITLTEFDSLRQVLSRRSF